MRSIFKQTKDTVLPKELALVERELISELDNVEIY